MLETADLEVIKKVFSYYDIKEDGDTTSLYGEPLADSNVLFGSLYPYFAGRKKDVTVQRQLGEYVLTVRNAKGDNVWINVALVAMTLISTTVVGSMLYGVDVFQDPQRIYMGLPFAIAIMTV